METVKLGMVAQTGDNGAEVVYDRVVQRRESCTS